MQSVGFEVRTTGSCSAVKYCTKSVFPQSRAHHAVCQHENWIYILAGKDGNITLKDFWRFNIGNHNWEKLNYRGDLPPHLQGHTLVSFKKLLLLFGGEFGDALTESSLWIINPDLGYVRKACLDVGSDRPCVRRYQSAVTYRDSMYVYGGYVDVKGSSSEFWRYDVEDEEWELIIPHQYSHDLPGRRYGHTAVIYKQSMWLYGGMNNLVPKQDLWCYSFVSERWERVKCKITPPPLTGHSAAVIGSQMVVYGGETNREAVNQVWTFNFTTLKWNQVIFVGPSPPSRTLHVCVMVNPAVRSEMAVKARSTPYLQNKTKEPIKRPKSSPGYRPACQPIERDNPNHKPLIFERTNSAIEIDTSKRESISDSCSVCKNRFSVPYRRCVSNVDEFLYMQPSPSENSKDILPLVPVEMDINYNDVYMLDKDAVRSGLDNPGISDSTEKLIEESQMCNSYNQGCLTSYIQGANDGYPDADSSKRKICMDCVNSAKSESVIKKHRLDPELILEDLEFQDCFPYNIQVPFPTRNQIPLQRLYRDPDNIETIELQDFKSVSSMDCCDKSSAIVTHNSSNTNSINYDIFSISRQSSGDAPVQARVGMFQIDAQIPRTANKDCDTTPQQLEMSFQQSDHRQISHNQHSGMERKSVSNKQEVPERPYLLIVGGKDKQSVNFTVKPLSIMKLQLSLS